MSTTLQKQPRQTSDLATNGDLPEGWVLASLPDVCDINPSKPPLDALPADSPVTFVPMPAVDADAGAITKPELRPFAKIRNGFTAFRDGDVIFAKITPCMENGKAAIARNLRNGLGFGSTEFHVLRSSRAVLPEYVYRFIRQESFRRAAEAEMTGSVGQRRVPADFLKQAELPVAPLAEQKRIVAKIEELLGQVNAVRARLAKVAQILKRFRQSVLSAACSGRLTEEWRAGRSWRRAAADLAAEIMRRREAQMRGLGPGAYKEPVEPDSSKGPDFPEEWAPVTLDQLTHLVTSGSRGWAKCYSDSGPRCIRAQDINTDHLAPSAAAHVRPPTNAEGRRTRVQFGDLLVTITGANVTKSALVDTDPGEAYVSQHVALVRLVEPEVRGFVYLWTVSPQHGRAKLLGDAYGAGKPGLNLDNIREMVLAFPPLEEQHEIVRRVEDIFKLADAIEKRIETATKRADKLTQAILAKAFRGELVPTEAELARREGREYETASELLVRIKAESADGSGMSRGHNRANRRGRAKQRFSGTSPT